MLEGNKAGHVERGPDLDATTLDLALAAVSAAVLVHWGEAGQGGDLVAIDPAEFGQFGDQGAGDDIANAGHALQQFLFGAPEGAGFDQRVNRLVNTRPLGFETLKHGLERALRNAVPSFCDPLLFGIDHDHQLAPPRHQFGEPHREIIGQRPYGLGEVGDHRSVDRVRLGQPANGAGEPAHLARVDNGDWQPGFNQRSGDHAFIAATGLEHHQTGRQRLQSRDQCAQAFRIRSAAERSAIRPDMHIDPRLRYVDADKAIDLGLDIHHPASSMRARAQTTVRVSWDAAGATRSLTASTTRTHSGYRPGSVRQTSSQNQATPR
jgi:hypothetical protein